MDQVKKRRKVDGNNATAFRHVTAIAFLPEMNDVKGEFGKMSFFFL